MDEWKSRMVPVAYENFPLNKETFLKYMKDIRINESEGIQWISRQRLLENESKKKNKHHGGVKHGKGKHGRIHHMNHEKHEKIKEEFIVRPWN